MSRHDSLPSYRRHKASKQAVTTLTDAAGNRKDFYLGAYGSADSKREYARLIAEWTASGRRIPHTGPEPADITVNELILRFWHHAEEHYRHADGTPTSELGSWRLSLRPLKQLYGHAQARDFGPLALRAVRQSMVETGLCRTNVNQRVWRLKKLFRWAVSVELIPATVYQALATVPGLQKGRTEAPDHPPIEPVPDSVVELTLTKCNRYVGAMVRFQRLTGCRPGEVCRLRRCDIDTTGEVWFFRPPHHKTAHKGQTRCIAIGPKAQAILAEFPTEADTDYIFSPARMWTEKRKRLRETRLTAVQPSQVCRCKRRPKHTPGERYTTSSYAYSVRRAAVAAGAAHWHPNQLRHTRGSEVRRDFGLVGAQVTLGHANAQITQVYAETDRDLAARIALATG